MKANNNLEIHAEALESIIESKRKFIAYLESKTKSRDLAEDIFQTSILKALQSSKDLKNEEALIPWFYSILKNTLMDQFRDSKKTSEKSEMISRFISELTDEIVSNKESREQLCACFKELIKTINPQYASLINKIDLNEESLEALAEAENTTINNLTVKLHRARKALKESLEISCGACTKHGCLNCTCSM